MQTQGLCAYWPLAVNSAQKSAAYGAKHCSHSRANHKKTSSTLGILSFCAFEQEIGSVGELTGLGVACREHEADAGVFGIDFSSGAEVVTGSGIILPNEADIAEEAQDFELLIGAQRDLFSSFFEEFDGVDVLMLLGEGDGHVRSGGEEVRVELYGGLEQL